MSSFLQKPSGRVISLVKIISLSRVEFQMGQLKYVLWFMLSQW